MNIKCINFLHHPRHLTELLLFGTVTFTRVNEFVTTKILADISTETILCVVVVNWF